MNIHAGDQVVVITGKDKGKTGTVLRTLPATSRIVVTGINMRTKHVKATPQSAGQRLQYEASLDASNVMLLDPKTKKRTRVGFSVNDKGRKERIARQSGEVLVRSAKPAAGKPETEKTKKDDAKAEQESKKAQRENKAVTEKVEKPQKKPFWKKVGFGASEVEETGAEDSATSKKTDQDRSSSEQGQAPDVFSHQRGQ
tara:strand:- start:505 stop:1098 length:594 start_codon:yes stop_codon:yes gene_type:complete